MASTVLVSVPAAVTVARKATVVLARACTMGMTSPTPSIGKAVPVGLSATATPPSVVEPAT